MISKITIQNTATFGKEPQTLTDLKKLNFFFGANGSGKTTISRLIENDAQFQDCKITWEGGSRLDTFVFNRDFIENNFRQTIKGVFTLGKGHVQIQEQINSVKKSIECIDSDIAQLKKTLSGENDNEGKKAELKQLEEEYDEVFWKAKKKYEGNLKEGMRHFLDVKAKFKNKVLEESNNMSTPVVPLSELEIKATTVFNKSLGEVSSLSIPVVDALLSYETNYILSKVIIGKENVDISVIIKKLGNSDWVRQGITYYKVNDGVCPFCQQKTDERLAQSLTEYFDTTFQNDMKAIATLISNYESEAKNVQQPIQSLIDSNNRFINSEKLKYEKITLDKLISANIHKIRQKQKEPSQIIELNSVQGTVENIVTLLNDANNKIGEHNQLVHNRSKEQKVLTAQIWRFIVEDLKDDIKKYKQHKMGLDKAIESLTNQLIKKNGEKRSKNTELQNLEKQTTSILPTRDAINERLRSFGFQSFTLKTTDDAKAYKLIRQDGTDVQQTLSEGEKNFLAFLYFFHLLEGSHEESGTTTNRVVVFDDPICSLDNDVLFIVSTLIRDLYKDTKDGISAIKQIFVMTHNVYFHKEVTFEQIGGKEITFWLVKKNGVESFVEKHTCNPISTAYELLWSEVKNSNRNKATIQNILRRILENYFKLLGNISFDDIIEKIDDKDKCVCNALVSWIHDGSHSVFDEDFYTPLDETAIDHYLDVFKQIFEKTGHIAHYDMMTNFNHGENS
jgi:wobble nucleotide-excising tRNase